MSDQILDQCHGRMETAIKALQNHLGKVRTGRASLTVLDGIKVDYYGTLSSLNQVATLSIPEPRLITIQPWESHLISQIEKAIEKANIGLNPTNDGKLIRLPIPQLTEERRLQIVKQVKSYGEECRVSIRQHRKEANDALKKAEKDGVISEDDFHKKTEAIQKATDDAIAQVDKIIATKEQDVMKV